MGKEVAHTENSFTVNLANPILTNIEDDEAKMSSKYTD
jgi:hypothetical protein